MAEAPGEAAREQAKVIPGLSRSRTEHKITAIDCFHGRGMVPTLPFEQYAGTNIHGAPGQLVHEYMTRTFRFRFLR